MMKKYIKYVSAILFGTFILTSCSDEDVSAPGKYNIPEAPASGTLKALAQARSLKIGNLLSFNDLTNQQKLDLIKSEFDNVSFEKEMMHGDIVQNDGSMNFSKADAMLAWAKNNGLTVFGNSLISYRNQNASYLSNVAPLPGSEFYGPNMVSNPTINENIDGYQQMNPNPGGGCGPRIALGEGRNGTKGLYVDGTCEAITAHDYWRVQIATTLKGSMAAGSKYRVEFWIKAKAPGNIQFEIRGGAEGGDGVRYIAPIGVTSDWSKVVINHTALGTETGVVTFDLNNESHTEYWIDDMAVYEVSDTPVNMAANPKINANIDGYQQMNPNPGGGCGPRISWAETDGRNGSGALYVDGTCEAITANDYWRVQIGTTLASNMVAGETYLFEFWIKAKTPGNIQFEIRGGVEGGDGVRYVAPLAVNADWTKISVEHTAIGTETGVITFDLNNDKHTEYWIDDLSVTLVVKSIGESSAEEKAALDEAMRKWITGCISHFKADVQAWDVVNKPLAGGGVLRKKNNTADAAVTDYFHADVLGRSYVLKSFLAAKAADPNALFFISDDKLESDPVKLDSLIAFVAELKAAGAKVDGIGAQIHIDDPKSYGSIREMFQKLANTGLLVKISELDVKVHINGREAGELTQTDEEFQAAMYEYIIKSYLEIVPKEQQYGITISGVNDGSSSIKPMGKKYFFPLPWDDNFKRKPAYDAIYKALE